MLLLGRFGIDQVDTMLAAIPEGSPGSYTPDGNSVACDWLKANEDVWAIWLPPLYCEANQYSNVRNAQWTRVYLQLFTHANGCRKIPLVVSSALLGPILWQVLGLSNALPVQRALTLGGMESLAFSDIARPSLSLCQPSFLSVLLCSDFLWHYCTDSLQQTCCWRTGVRWAFISPWKVRRAVLAVLNLQRGFWTTVTWY